MLKSTEETVIIYIYYKLNYHVPKGRVSALWSQVRSAEGEITVYTADET